MRLPDADHPFWSYVGVALMTLSIVALCYVGVQWRYR